MLSPLGTTPAWRAASWMVSTGMRKLKPWTTCSPWSEVKVAAPMTWPRSSKTGPAAVALDDGGVGLDDALAADVLLEARDAAGRDRGLVLRGAAQELVGGHDTRKPDDEQRLTQMQVRAVPGQAHDRQLRVLDLQDRHVAAMLLAGLARGIRARTDDHVGGRAVELDLRRVGLAIRKVDLERPLEGEAATVLGARRERPDALGPRSVGQAIQFGDTGRRHGLLEQLDRERARRRPPGRAARRGRSSRSSRRDG